MTGLQYQLRWPFGDTDFKKEQCLFKVLSVMDPITNDKLQNLLRSIKM